MTLSSSKKNKSQKNSYNSRIFMNNTNYNISHSGSQIKNFVDKIANKNFKDTHSNYKKSLKRCNNTSPSVSFKEDYENSYNSKILERKIKKIEKNLSIQKFEKNNNYPKLRKNSSVNSNKISSIIEHSPAFFGQIRSSFSKGSVKAKKSSKNIKLYLNNSNTKNHVSNISNSQSSNQLNYINLKKINEVSGTAMILGNTYSLSFNKQTNSIVPSENFINFRKRKGICDKKTKNENIVSHENNQINYTRYIQKRQKINKSLQNLNKKSFSNKVSELL